MIPVPKLRFFGGKNKGSQRILFFAQSVKPKQQRQRIVQKKRIFWQPKRERETQQEEWFLRSSSSSGPISLNSVAVLRPFPKASWRPKKVGTRGNWSSENREFFRTVTMMMWHCQNSLKNSLWKHPCQNQFFSVKFSRGKERKFFFVLFLFTLTSIIFSVKFDQLLNVQCSCTFSSWEVCVNTLMFKQGWRIFFSFCANFLG